MSTLITYNIDDNKDDIMEKNQKDAEYLKYITDHIGGVKKSFVDYFLPLFNHILK